MLSLFLSLMPGAAKGGQSVQGGEGVGPLLCRTPTGRLIEVLAAMRAKPLAVFLTNRVRRKGENNTLSHAFRQVEPLQTRDGEGLAVVAHLKSGVEISPATRADALARQRERATHQELILGQELADEVIDQAPSREDLLKILQFQERACQLAAQTRVRAAIQPPQVNGQTRRRFHRCLLEYAARGARRGTRADAARRTREQNDRSCRHSAPPRARSKR